MNVHYVPLSAPSPPGEPARSSVMVTPLIRRSKHEGVMATIAML